MSFSESPRLYPLQPTPAQVGVRTEPKPCGDCSLCCKVMDVAVMQKPMGFWCRQFRKGARCTIYADRPQVCQDYQCTWTLADPLGEEWRPDRAGFVLHPGPVGSEVEIVVDPGRPDAWRREPYYSMLKRWSDRRQSASITRVIVRTRSRVIVVFPEEDIDLGPANGMPYIQWGYENVDGVAKPYARFSNTAG